jgi:hypothetical protein
MNQNEVLIGQTIEAIGMMYRSLESLRERVLPVNPTMFAVMAQGPMDDLRVLLDELERLSAACIPASLGEQAESQRLSERVVLPEAA